MAQLSRQDVRERVQRLGRNSSHFVWLLGEFKFIEIKNQHVWTFAYQEIGEVTVVALEPLCENAEQASAPFTEMLAREFKQVWARFVAEVRPGVCTFVGIYSDFLILLETVGFSSIQVGEEPWVDLTDCIPRGNSGKGVRSARNQALKAGLRIEEWTPSQVADGAAGRIALLNLYETWSSRHLIALSGFLNSTAPFAYSESRRYFVAFEGEDVRGFLVATPVPARESYFLEDLILHPSAPRGTGELLTLEAMVALRDSGVKEASLGVVSMNAVGCRKNESLPRSLVFLTQTLPNVLKRFYNFKGLEVYRKRFKPHRWDRVHVAVYDVKAQSGKKTVSWLSALLAILLAFDPKLQISLKGFKGIAQRLFAKHPVSSVFAVLSLISFIGVNHLGKLPSWALQGYGFSAGVPFSQWAYRSILSDLLFFDAIHFAFCAGLFVALIAWAERSHRKGFVFAFVAIVSLLDDPINYLILTKPFSYFQPAVFSHLVSTKDVGCSLGLATLAGLQLCQLRRYREPVFAILAVALVLGYAFTSSPFQFVINLNHFVFLVIGYLIGKMKFERSRALSKEASKRKPPPGRCVSVPQERRKKQA